MPLKITRNWKWVVTTISAVAATRIYYVREMLAALVIFAVLFVAVWIALLIVLFLDRAGERLIHFATTSAARGWSSVPVSHTLVPHRVTPFSNVNRMPISKTRRGDL